MKEYLYKKCTKEGVSFFFHNIFYWVYNKFTKTVQLKLGLTGTRTHVV